MLLLHLTDCIGGCIILAVIIQISAIYAYRVNSMRQAQDPEKWDPHPVSPWIAAIIPLVFAINVILFTISTLFFGFFLFTFPFMLLFIRKPFLFKWLRKQMLKLGTLALKINTELLNMAGFNLPSSQQPSYEVSTT